MASSSSVASSLEESRRANTAKVKTQRALRLSTKVKSIRNLVNPYHLGDDSNHRPVQPGQNDDDLIDFRTATDTDTEVPVGDEMDIDESAPSLGGDEEVQDDLLPELQEDGIEDGKIPLLGSPASVINIHDTVMQVDASSMGTCGKSRSSHEISERRRTGGGETRPTSRGKRRSMQLPATGQATAFTSDFSERVTSKEKALRMKGIRRQRSEEDIECVRVREDKEKRQLSGRRQQSNRGSKRLVNDQDEAIEAGQKSSASSRTARRQQRLLSNTSENEDTIVSSDDSASRRKERKSLAAVPTDGDDDDDEPARPANDRLSRSEHTNAKPGMKQRRTIRRGSTGTTSGEDTAEEEEGVIEEVGERRAGSRQRTLGSASSHSRSKGRREKRNRILFSGSSHEQRSVSKLMGTESNASGDNKAKAESQKDSAIIRTMSRGSGHGRELVNTSGHSKGRREKSSKTLGCGSSHDQRSGSKLMGTESNASGDIKAKTESQKDSAIIKTMSRGSGHGRELVNTSSHSKGRREKSSKTLGSGSSHDQRSGSKSMGTESNSSDDIKSMSEHRRNKTMSRGSGHSRELGSNSGHSKGRREKSKALGSGSSHEQRSVSKSTGAERNISDDINTRSESRRERVSKKRSKFVNQKNFQVAPINRRSRSQRNLVTETPAAAPMAGVGYSNSGSISSLTASPRIASKDDFSLPSPGANSLAKPNSVANNMAGGHDRRAAASLSRWQALPNEKTPSDLTDRLPTPPKHDLSSMCSPGVISKKSGIISHKHASTTMPTGTNPAQLSQTAHCPSQMTQNSGSLSGPGRFNPDIFVPATPTHSTGGIVSELSTPAGLAGDSITPGSQQGSGMSLQSKLAQLCSTPSFSLDPSALNTPGGLISELTTTPCLNRGKLLAMAEDVPVTPGLSIGVGDDLMDTPGGFVSELTYASSLLSCGNEKKSGVWMTNVQQVMLNESDYHKDGAPRMVRRHSLDSVSHVDEGAAEEPGLITKESDFAPRAPSRQMSLASIFL